ncbi:J domain-containing protein [Prochlorococcus marinus]|uniref:J domain-containing protein n=1 Tax=Prochlorococcus marinus TaxID=1219 RepID=UPI0022B52056|nr:J domain-containing protein [Prochlorococcus marinus]
MTVPNTYYELLGVSHNSDLQTLKKAFHRLSKSLHPDTTVLPVDEAAKKFYILCEAYELLSDPIRRKAYDKTLRMDRLSDDSPSKDIAVDISRESVTSIGHRRPLSGGELFSLLLLGIAISISLLLGIGFAFLDGKQLQVSPSWLNSTNTLIQPSSPTIQDVDFASR